MSNRFQWVFCQLFTIFVFFWSIICQLFMCCSTFRKELRRLCFALRSGTEDRHIPGVFSHPTLKTSRRIVFFVPTTEYAGKMYTNRTVKTHKKIMIINLWIEFISSVFQKYRFFVIFMYFRQFNRFA